MALTAAAIGDHLTPAQARRRIEALRSQIRHHDYRYYVLDRPTISDAAYDALMQQLQRLEALFPELVTPDSPTQRVAGGPREGFRTPAHHAPMLSLDSTTNAAVVRQFDARMHQAIGPSARYVLEPEFDGLSIEVSTSHGRRLGGAARSHTDTASCLLNERGVVQRAEDPVETILDG